MEASDYERRNVTDSTTEIGQADEKTRILPQSSLLKTPQKHIKKSAFSLAETAPPANDFPK